MKISGRRLAQKATKDYMDYRRIKKGAKRFCSKIVRRFLKRQIDEVEGCER